MNVKPDNILKNKAKHAMIERYYYSIDENIYSTLFSTFNCKKALIIKMEIQEAVL